MFRGFSERIGKIIPNEFSKLNGISNFTQFIPGIGPFVSGTQRGISGLDNAFTAYGDGASVPDVFNVGFGGFSGRGMDPGMFGSPNQNRGVFNSIGSGINIASLFARGGNGGFQMPQDGNMMASIQRGMQLLGAFR